MVDVRASLSGIVDAPASKVYATLRDYHGGHAAILPPQYFARLAVEEGGQGAGTVISVVMTRLGGGQTLRMRVSEPEPARVLVEEDTGAGVRTTFTVEPIDAERAHVTIESTATGGEGIGAWLQSLVAPLAMKRMFAKQLKLLNEHLAQS